MARFGLCCIACSVTSAAGLAQPSDRLEALVIGGTGFMGSHAVQALLDSRVAVEIVSDGHSTNPWGSSVVPETICDRHKSCLGQKLRERHWDLVVDFPIFDTGDADAIIQSAPWIGHYIFPSSDDVYMVSNRSLFVRGATGGILEESAVRPSDASARSRIDSWDAYGAGKQQLEQVFAGSALNFTALRLPDVWGPFESTGRLVTFLRALEHGKSIGMNITTGNPVFKSSAEGDDFRPGFVFARDVAEMIMVLLRSGPQRRPLNVAVWEAPTFKEMVAEAYNVLSRVSSPKWPVGSLKFDSDKEVPLLSTDIGRLDISRAEAIGFAPTPWKRGWSEAIISLFNASRNDSLAADELALCIKHCKPTCYCEPTTVDAVHIV